MKASSTLLDIAHLSKSFGGLKAVQDVSLQVPQGSLTALIGPNGAGKTTLFALMSGFIEPDRGTVRFAGQDITGQTPERNARMGMTRTFQIVQPFAAQTVRENIAVGAHLHLARRRDALARADEVAARVGLASQLDKLASDLTVAGRKRLELARALATQPKLLLLDEVLAGLTPSEINNAVTLVREIRQRGSTIIFIEHNMRAVLELCDRLIVLNHGQVIASGMPREVMNDPAVVSAYLGTPHG